jgi:Cytochrome c554 and c-prime
MKTSVKVLIGCVLIGVFVYLYYTEIKPVVIFGLRSDYARAIPFQKVPEGLTSLKAESCGECHREIYDEWKTSIHAHAYEDPFFQAYWKKDKNVWVCLNCHTPLENQQPTLIKEIPRGRVEKAVQEPNPQYDPEYQKESVTCAVCHVRDAQVCYRCHNVVSGPAQFYNVGPCGTYAEYEGKFFMQERGFICQSCHMPEIDRPVATNSPIRRGRKHLWRGGHDPDMVKRAVGIQVRADNASPKPGDRVGFTLTLVNAGAGHKIPTGDPDRYFTVEFSVEDRQGRVLDQHTSTMGRWIMWQPAIVELYDNRLLPLASREYQFAYQLPVQAEGLKLKTRVQYHILTDKQHEMLQTKYGLTGNDPYRFVVYEREFPLSGALATALSKSDQPAAVSPQPNELSCKAGAEG